MTIRTDTLVLRPGLAEVFASSLRSREHCLRALEAARNSRFETGC